MYEINSEYFFLAAFYFWGAHLRLEPPCIQVNMVWLQCILHKHMGIVTFSVIRMAAVPNIMHICDMFNVVIMYSNLLANIQLFFYIHINYY